jgi:hypothetical protein
MFFDKTFVLSCGVWFGLVGFEAVDGGAIFREPALSFLNIFVISPDFFLLFSLFFFLLVFLFFLDPFALFDLLIEDALHLAAFSLQFWNFALEKLFGEGSSHMALLLKLLRFVGIIHLRSLYEQGVSEGLKLAEGRPNIINLQWNVIQNQLMARLIIFIN